jgi:hypothetical protein
MELSVRQHAGSGEALLPLSVGFEDSGDGDQQR